MSGAGSRPRRGMPLWAIVAIIVTLVALVIGAGVFWFLRTFERVEDDVEVGYQGMARVNPYYAVELFLEEAGIPAESRFGLGELPPTDHVILVLTRDLESRRSMESELYDWVARGGHLVVAAAPPPGFDEDEDGADDHQDPLLEMAGLRLRRYQKRNDGISALTPVEPVEPVEPDAGPSEDDDGDEGPQGLLALFRPRAEREVVSVSSPLAAGPRLLRLEVDRSWSLVHRDAEPSSGDQGPRPFLPLAYSAVSQGQVSAMVDPYFLTNRAIGEHDHARLLAAITHQRGRPAGAVLVIRARAEGFWALLWNHGWMVLYSLGALLLAWVWMASRRFGPIVPDPKPERRSLLEHIEATGAFLWRQGYQAELLESAREAVRLKLAARLGGETDMEGSDLARAISQETGVRESRVHEAFYSAGPQDRRTFTDAMRELQRLWRER